MGHPCGPAVPCLPWHQCPLPVPGCTMALASPWWLYTPQGVCAVHLRLAEVSRKRGSGLYLRAPQSTKAKEEEISLTGLQLVKRRGCCQLHPPAGGECWSPWPTEADGQAGGRAWGAPQKRPFLGLLTAWKPLPPHRHRVPLVPPPQHLWICPPFKPPTLAPECHPQVCPRHSTA